MISNSRRVNDPRRGIASRSRGDERTLRIDWALVEVHAVMVVEAAACEICQAVDLLQSEFAALL